MGDPARVLTIGPEPEPWGGWLADLRAHLPVLGMLARKDFQTRYKRASLGVLWVVALPVLQALVLAVVFSQVGRFPTEGSYTTFVMSGIFGWAYLSGTVQAATTAIVEGASLADKVWFPRAILVLVPVLANAIGLLVSVVLLVAAVPLLGEWTGWRILLLVPASALLIALTTGLSLILSALHVYFRDMKFIVQAVLLVALYLAPIIYPAHLLGRWTGWLDLNPATGIIELFHAGATGTTVSVRALTVSTGVTIALLAAGAIVHRRRDRLFIDLL